MITVLFVRDNDFLLTSADLRWYLEHVHYLAVRSRAPGRGYNYRLHPRLTPDLPGRGSGLYFVAASVVAVLVRDRVLKILHTEPPA